MFKIRSLVDNIYELAARQNPQPSKISSEPFLFSFWGKKKGKKRLSVKTFDSDYSEAIVLSSVETSFQVSFLSSSSFLPFFLTIEQIKIGRTLSELVTSAIAAPGDFWRTEIGL